MLRLVGFSIALIFFTACSHRKISERAWVTQLQSKAGSIALSGDRQIVHPYFANLAVWAMLKTKPTAAEIKLAEHWIDWYLNHLNGPGPGLAVRGSIYDYKIADGLEISTLDYDSVDGYSGTFLMVLYQYYQVTHDQAFIDLRLTQSLMVIDAIQETTKDQLTLAKPNAPISYLMDNVEVWRGLEDYSLLMSAIGQHQKSIEIKNLASQFRKAIEARLWNSSQKVYRSSLESSPNQESFYPEAIASLWPILFKLPEVEARKEKIWQTFKEKFKKRWQTIKIDSFSWSFVAYLSVQMGDLETAELWEKSLHKNDHRAWPWHLGESAGYILYLDSLNSQFY